MKTELSALELHFLIKEFQVLINAKVEQIYQIWNEEFGGEFLFQFHVPGKGKRLLRVIMGKVLYLASHKGETPERPPGFCLYLRRKLKNARLREISQEGFERVINLLFETKDAKFNLHIELFSKGNVILADESDIVLSAMQYQEWKDRSIKPKQPYMPPKKGGSDANILNLSEESLKGLLVNSDKENLVKTLAIDLGLGGIFSEELCTMASVDKDVKSNSLSEEEISRLFKSSQEIISKEISPMIIHDDKDPKKIVNILPFNISAFKDSIARPFPSFNEAIDFVLTKKVSTSKIENVKKESKTRLDQVDEIINQQKLRISGLETSEKENQRKGEIIYENYPRFDELLNGIKKLRKDHSWKEVKEILKSKNLARSVNEKTGEITVEVDA